MEWKKGPCIGRGSSAAVYLATTATGDLFAVKSAELSSSVFLQKEQHFLSQLNSPNVISYMGFDINYYNNIPMFNLFMEYAPGGTISSIIKKHGGSLDESLIRSYTHQILLGLDHLHSNNLVHCDIKCENILIGENGVKIGDLGCAKLANDGEANDSVFSGTPVFMAPEVARGEEQGYAADVWAIGCVVIVMATGCNPWLEVSDPVSALYRIGNSDELPEIPRWLSPEIKDFLNFCLKRDAKERCTVKQLLRHPFVNNLNPDFQKVKDFTKNSPTSILDQDFWGSFEVVETSPATTIAVRFSGESPVERIRQLIKATASLCLPNWIDEEDWVTVRNNQVEESLKIFGSTCNESTNSESTRTESTGSIRIESSPLSKIHVEKMVDFEGFDCLMLENHVEGGNQSVTIGFASRFLDFENTLDDDYLLLTFKLLIMVFLLKNNLQTIATLGDIISNI